MYQTFEASLLVSTIGRDEETTRKYTKKRKKKQKDESTYFEVEACHLWGGSYYCPLLSGSHFQSTG